MAQLAEPGQRQRQAFCRLSVATGVADASVAWLFGAVGPTQPHQAVLAKAGMAVQAPSSAEIAAVAEACPVAPVQLTPRSHYERDRARADANGRPGMEESARPQQDWSSGADPLRRDRREL